MHGSGKAGLRTPRCALSYFCGILQSQRIDDAEEPAACAAYPLIALGRCCWRPRRPSPARASRSISTATSRPAIRAGATRTRNSRPKGAEAVFTPQVGHADRALERRDDADRSRRLRDLAMPATTADASRSYAGHAVLGHRQGQLLRGRRRAERLVHGRAQGARHASSPTAPVTWTQTDALKLGPNEKNTLRVTLEGQTVTVRINDTEVARFRGQAPDAPSHIGLVAASAPDATDTWQHDRLQGDQRGRAGGNAPARCDARRRRAAIATGAVTAAPSRAAARARCCSRTLSRSTIRPGVPKDDRARHRRRARRCSARRPARRRCAGTARSCSTTSMPAPACASPRTTSDPTTSYAGLIFWVKDSRNYYQAVIAPNGYFTVARVVDGKAVGQAAGRVDEARRRSRPAPRRRTRCASRPRAPTWRSPSTASRWRASRASRRSGPSYIGMLAASAPSKKGDTWSISDFKVTAPQ